MTPPPVLLSAPRRSLIVHPALVLGVAVCCWVAVPRPAAPPGTWLWCIGGVVLAVALMLTRRRQPRIDDRDLDRILGCGGLLTAAWIVLEWDVGEHCLAAAAASTSLVLGCLFWVLGTRESCWLLPAAPAPLLGAVPALGSVPAGAVGLVACLLGALVMVVRRGPGPREQLDRINPKRLVAPAVAAVLVVLVARGWSP
ncbi:hypothetical protein [Propionibacterium australiense]|uniref:Uncharacterized protein n=2 Tax=Propionibacterium australiense TaxID=119981 RepID=A0A383S703_9ACTN|nr:hypothetical protein [Propionibacterium australiense]SYZ33149.1 Hypothetical protein PROPAUS_1065 [Propionibacterium australiense]VEH89165.1 Uncharacterised protein [Propionibacterium australiense]